MRRALLAPALLLALAGRAWAASGPGSTAAPVLNRPVGARSSGLGQAFTGMPADPESLMFNPAGAGFMERSRLYAAYMNGLGGGGYGFAAAPLKRGAFTVTPAFLYFNSGSMTLDIGGSPAGSVIAESDSVGMLSAAFSPAGWAALGCTVKYARVDLAEKASASGLFYDAGVMVSPARNLYLGASSLNNGGEMKFEDEGDPAPAALRAGASWRVELNPPNLLDRSTDLLYSDLVLSSDWSRIKGEKGAFRSGLEMNMKMPVGLTLSLRFGYLFGGDDGSLSFGLGVRNGPWRFDFGYEAARDLSPRLPAAVSWEF